MDPECRLICISVAMRFSRCRFQRHLPAAAVPNGISSPGKRRKRRGGGKIKYRNVTIRIESEKICDSLRTGVKFIIFRLAALNLRLNVDAVGMEEWEGVGGGGGSRDMVDWIGLDSVFARLLESIQRTVQHCFSLLCKFKCPYANEVVTHTHTHTHTHTRARVEGRSISQFQFLCSPS